MFWALCQHKCLRLRDWVRGFEATLWQNLDQLYYAWCNCLLFLRVAPPLMFTVTFQSTPINSLAVPNPPSLGVYQYKFYACFCTIYVVFHLAQVFIRGNSGDLFPKHWNWQICHTHWALNFHFVPLAVSYELFPRWNQRQLNFLSIKHNSIL